MNSESTTTQAAPEDQERLARILDDYLVAIEQGRCVTPEDLLAQHPEDAEQLRGYLSGLNLFHAAAVVPGQTLGGSVTSDIGIPAALRTIGDYRLVREIGRGGMGVVYEAWQVSLRRRVALKVLPFTSAHDAKQIGRFKNEAQSAAQVQHPNIVPVFAVGEESGVHYYVMQLIEGQSLTGLLGALRAGGNSSCGSTAPNNAITYNSKLRSSQSETVPPHHSSVSAPMRSNETADHVRVVARLGIQAAEALHAAHEYGIVHRDVKPSNLLLDDQGKLWVTDFGLARCRENPGLTQTGDVLGTMRYMSPEQALGRGALVDQRTDIYSLGLTMYELSTLNHPADELGEVQQLFDRNRRAIKPLRHWNRHIPNDFQTIVLKCIAEFPHERYNSAKELSDDLERFMEGRPIEASPPSIISRAGKWAKRHRGLVYATAAVLLVAGIGAGISSMMVARVRTAANERAYSELKDHVRDAGQLMDMYTGYADELNAVPGAEVVRQKMLQGGIDYYDRIASQVAGAPAFQNELAVAQSSLGLLNEKLGNRDKALEAHENAVKTWEHLLNGDPHNTEFAHSLAVGLNNLGLLVAEDGRPAEGLEMLKRAIELQTEKDGRVASTEFSADLATSHSNLGLVLSQMNAKDAATTEFKEAIRINEPLVASSDHSEAAAAGLAASYTNLASLEASGSPIIAEEHYKKSISILRDLVKADPINRLRQGDLARTYNNLGYLASQNKDWKRAEVCYADAIQLQENLVKSSPLDAAYRRDLAVSYNNLGVTQSRANRLSEAEASFQNATRLQDTLLAAAPTDVPTLGNQGNVWNSLGMLYDKQQRLVEAGDAYQQAIKFQAKALQGANADAAVRSNLSRHYFNYARNLVAQQKYDDALQTILERKKLWLNQTDQLFSVAQELGLLQHKLSGKAGSEKTNSECVQAAVETLRQALDRGLSQDRLKDPSLAGLSQLPEFRQLLQDKTVGLATPANNPKANFTRVN
ncbi:MAG TPA: protein kinase [Lacipirellulaceae bacterium]|nr:protein kinase [Lacipirellulaceae bacterium]